MSTNIPLLVFLLLIFSFHHVGIRFFVGWYKNNLMRLYIFLVPIRENKIIHVIPLVWQKTADRMEMYQRCVSSVCSYTAIFLYYSWHVAYHTRHSTGDWGMPFENLTPPGSSEAPANCLGPMHLPSPLPLLSASWNFRRARFPTIHMAIFFPFIQQRCCLKFSYECFFLNTMCFHFLIFSIVAILHLLVWLFNGLCKFSMENSVHLHTKVARCLKQCTQWEANKYLLNVEWTNYRQDVLLAMKETQRRVTCCFYSQSTYSRAGSHDRHKIK